MDRALVDSSVVLDIVQDDPKWASWSIETLDAYSGSHELVINSIIYAEVSIGFARIEELEATLQATRLRVMAMPREALFLAGKAFLRYRKRSGSKSSPLPDFFIGAHAAVDNMALITRDVKRVSSYFPNVDLVSP